MVRSVVSKVMWVGRGTVFLVGLAVILALVFGLASMALGANGSPWILGQGNVATNITSLGGAAGVDGPMLRIANNDAGTDDTALDLNVQGGEAPMTVDSPTKVTNLNADRLDGKGAGNFLPKAHYTKSASSTGSDAGGGQRSAVLLCDAGDALLSGGHSGLDAGTTLVLSLPVDQEQGWFLQWINDGTADNIGVSVYCADYAPLH